MLIDILLALLLFLSSEKKNKLSDPTHASSLGLADAMHSADGLQLMRWVENGLYKQHMCSLDDVQAVWPCVQRQQQDVDLLIIFESTQVLLKGNHKHTIKWQAVIVTFNLLDNIYVQIQKKCAYWQHNSE